MFNNLEYLRNKLSDRETEVEKLKADLKNEELRLFCEEIQNLSNLGYEIHLDLSGYSLEILIKPPNLLIESKVSNLFNEIAPNMDQTLSFYPEGKPIPEILRKDFQRLGGTLYGYETKRVDHAPATEYDQGWEIYRFLKDGHESFWRVGLEDNNFQFEYSKVEPTEVTVKAWKDENYIYYV